MVLLQSLESPTLPAGNGSVRVAVHRMRLVGDTSANQIAATLAADAPSYQPSTQNHPNTPGRFIVAGG